MTATLTRRKTKPKPSECTDPIHALVMDRKKPVETNGRGKPRSPPKAAQPEPIESTVQRIALIHLRNHPANPEPGKQDVEETAEWLKSRGQEEPLVVRRGDEPITFQVLAGKRRFLAAKLLGWSDLECRVRHDLADEKAAIAYMAASNAQRHAETPIRQAMMLRAMLDAGASEIEAGAVYGLSADSSVRNKLQLLKLPAVWQERIVSGETPETAARCLVPYAELEPLMTAIGIAYVRDRESEFDADRWASRKGFGECVHEVVRHRVRPVEHGQSHNYGSDLGWSHPCYIWRTPEIDDEIGVVTLPLGPNGKSVTVAVNAERYDELQIPLIKAKLAKKQGRSTAVSDDDASSGRAKRDRTPAQQKSIEREQDEQLESRIRRWRHEWLRELIAGKLRQKVPDHWVLTKIVLWCLGQHWSFGANNQLQLDHLVIELTGSNVGTSGTTIALDSRITQHIATQQNLLEVICKALVVPESQPDYPVWHFDFVEQLAADLAVDLTDAWLVMQASGKADERINTFFEMHNSRQLRAAATDLGVHVPETASKFGAIKLLNAVQRTLPLPKSIAAVGGGTKRRAKCQHRTSADKLTIFPCSRTV